MRFLILAAALAFSVGAVTTAQACEYMQNVKTDKQQVVAADKAPKTQSTPIVIPEKVESKS